MTGVPAPDAAAPSGRVSVEVLDHDDALAGILSPWDRLACATGSALGAPVWLRAWWRHLAPAGARLRVLVCRRDDVVIAVIALLAERERMAWRYAPLGADCGVHAVVVHPGAEAQVARAVAPVLRRMRPRIGQLTLRPSLADRRTGFDRALARAWRSMERVGPVNPVPEATIHPDGFDAWLAAKSRHFRKRDGQRRRGLERAGGRVVRAEGPERVDEALAAYAALHHGRWGSRSPLSGAAARAAMAEAAVDLVPAGRWRIWTVRDPADRIVAVEIVVAAGRRFLSWTGGFDPEWSASSPSMVLLTAAIADAHEAGADVFDFGEGTQDYKRRLADRAYAIAEVRRFPSSPAGTGAAGGMLLRAAMRRARGAAGGSRT